MPKFGKAAALPMLLSLALAATAGAQDAQCDVDENSGGLGMAIFALTAARQPGATDAERSKQLQTAIGRMFGEDQKKIDADNARNPAGRAWTLGRVYMMFLSLPDMPPVTTRGALGFKTNPTGVVDLAAGIDSAFKVVEEKVPGCAPAVAEWRRQPGWVKLVQQAMDLAQANKVDSAEAVAKIALRISAATPYPHLTLGNVAAARMQYVEAINHYKTAVDEAGKDTIFNSIRRNILYTMGNFAADAAQVDTVKKNKEFYFTEGLAAWDALAKDPGTTYAEVARQGKSLMLRAIGDTAQIRASCREAIDKPQTQSFLALIQCGVMIIEIKDFADAAKLFEAAHAMNPYNRDGLFYLAVMQIQYDQLEKAFPTIDRLVALDPSNPINLKLYYDAWNAYRKRYMQQQDALGKQINAMTGRTAADQAKRKVLIDSVAKLDGLRANALNKAVEWNTKADSMPVAVTFTEFTPGPEKTTLSGEIRNRSDAEKSYVINLEFLDKDGKTVATGKATVDKVGPKRAGTFNLTVTAKDIVAYKYAPVS